jgi:hypothetical protein
VFRDKSLLEKDVLSDAETFSTYRFTAASFDQALFYFAPDLLQSENTLTPDFVHFSTAYAVKARCRIMHNTP